MKSKIIFFMLVALGSTAFTVKGQNPLYPQQSTKHIPFGKKLPPPPSFNEFQKNMQQLRMPYQGLGSSSQPGTQIYPGIQPNGMNLSRHQNVDASPMIDGSNTTTFHLVKDINTLKQSYPSWFAVLNNVTYFAADDGVHGSELWRSDGTSAGTYLVKDINPGWYSANINEITAANGKIYFSAYTDAEGQQPWVSDGTTDGTQLLKNIPGSYLYGSYPTQFVNVNGTVFFITDGYSVQSEIWKTDGTEAGTVMVKDLALTDGVNYIYQSTAANGLLFFAPAYSNYGQVLGRSDGTDAGTYMIYPYFNYYSGPLQLTEFNNKLYFSAEDGSGRKLWMSDGTFEGTSYAPNNNPVTLQGNSYDYFSPHPFTIVGKALYFWAYTSVTGWELYKYQPSLVANIELVKNISPGTENTQFNYYEMTNVNDTLYFKITNPDGGDAIWKSKGKAGNTEKVISFAPGEYLYGLFNGYGTLYFIKGGATYGYELWKTDGAEAGTVIVKDINAGSASSNPYSLTAFNSKIIFAATQGNHGYELWITDGSESGTTEVKDINKTTTDNFNPYNITAYTHGVMFTAYTAKHGTRMYKSDGTDAGTKLLNDSITSDNTTYFYNFSSKGDKVYFEGINAAGYAIYETNGTNNDTKRVTRFDSNYIYKYSIADNGTVFYAIYNSFTGVYELWANDGLGGQNIFLTNTLYYNDYLITVDNTAYFVAGDFTTGYELWKSDGTVAGTGLVKDIYPGDYGSYPSNLYNFNGKLYFAADYGLGPFIWTSDGTDAGTKVVKAMYMNSPFAQANGKLFFCGYNIIGKGYELYATDGTGAGTKLVKDIFRGPLSSIPYSLVSGDTLLYFMANDGKHGYELWTSNGTKDGTHLVKNITSGIGDSYFYPMVNVKDNLFFMSSISDTSSPGGFSSILWQSDGTKTGTKKVAHGITNINGLTASGDMLFFSGYTYATGQELYVGTVGSGFKPATSLAKNDIIAPSQKTNNAFGARLLTNPVTDQLKFSVVVKIQQAAQIMISNASGRVFKAERRDLASGTNMFSYNTQTWTPGMYMIKITASDGSSSLLKALK